MLLAGRLHSGMALDTRQVHYTILPASGLLLANALDSLTDGRAQKEGWKCELVMTNFLLWGHVRILPKMLPGKAYTGCHSIAPHRHRRRCRHHCHRHGRHHCSAPRHLDFVALQRNLCHLCLE